MDKEEVFKPLNTLTMKYSMMLNLEKIQFVKKLFFLLLSHLDIIRMEVIR